MDIKPDSPFFLAALKDFQRARQRGMLERMLAHLAGKSDDLLAYDEVAESLHAGDPIERGLQTIPLDKIVGSVNRYADFTRTFLPRRSSGKRRWAEVKAVIKQRGEIPPIIVFQIDQVYFVLDGNHRVSVARELGYRYIPAYVTEIETPVPLAPDTGPDELICKAKYVQFLEETQLKTARPALDLGVTAPGQYRLLSQQIEQHRQRLSRTQAGEVSTPAAAVDWYDNLYLPLVRIIRERGVLRYFPERTETDLYAWVVAHQSELRESLGWEVNPDQAADDLVAQFSHEPKQVIHRLKERMLDALTPDPLEAGPPPGQWRREQVSTHHDERLFIDILVPMSGLAVGWQALDQAFVVAEREHGRLHGLHVIPGPTPDAAAESLRQQFNERCAQANLPGELTFEQGQVPRKICERARWSDLIVLGLSHLPRPRPDDRLISGFGTLVRRCGRPVLAVSGETAPLERALLAYDGSPKAREALFVAAYLAGKCHIPLTVVTVLEAGHITTATLAEARHYLESRGVEATYVRAEGMIALALIRTALLYECDFMIMGGYGFNPVLEVVLGSEVDEILRARRWPVLICR